MAKMVMPFNMLRHVFRRRVLLLGPAMLALTACVATVPVDAPPVSVMFFTPFSAALDAQAQQVISDVAQDARANPGRSVIVSGFADATASPPATTRQLSELRARAVMDALVAKGVASDKIVLRPRGGAKADPGVESRRVDVSFGR